MQLSDCFDKMKAFDISDGASYLYDGYIVICSEIFDSFFDFIRDMGDYLNSSSKVIASSFFFYHREINLPRSDTTFARHRLIEKSLVVSEIEIGFESIGCHKGLSMFEG